MKTKKFWNKKSLEYETDPKVEKFLIDIWKVCEKHELSISHEDTQGGFIVENISDANKTWLFSASTEL
jgi:hypothetical protein